MYEPYFHEVTRGLWEMNHNGHTLTPPLAPSSSFPLSTKKHSNLKVSLTQVLSDFKRLHFHFIWYSECCSFLDSLSSLNYYY